MLVERIARFLCDPQGDSFEELALAAFAFQFERVEPYRTLCDGRGVSPATVRDWREVPAVPALAMKRLALHADEPLQVFRSSGTASVAAAGKLGRGGGAAEAGDSGDGSGARSVHYQPYPDLYHHAIDCSFP